MRPCASLDGHRRHAGRCELADDAGSVEHEGKHESALHVSREFLWPLHRVDNPVSELPVRTRHPEVADATGNGIRQPRKLFRNPRGLPQGRRDAG